MFPELLTHGKKRLRNVLIPPFFDKKINFCGCWGSVVNSSLLVGLIRIQHTKEIQSQEAGNRAGNREGMGNQF